MANPQSNPFEIITAEKDSLSSEIQNLIADGYLKLTTDSQAACFLSYDQSTLSIQLNTDDLKLSLAIDFVGGKSQHRRQYGGGKSQPLPKACGLYKHPEWTIFDATAGLGGDAFVLASLGATVTLCEQHPALYALLLDAMRRGSENADVQHIIKRLRCVHHNSQSYLRNINETSLIAPDVIYLDPMYPERKKSAKIKKEMQILQELVGHTQPSPALFDIALATAKHRVVVKRPKTATALSDKKPSYTVSSVNTRYDVYVT